jgi:hypothetical protein
MNKSLLCATVLLLSGTAMQAASFTFSYSGAGVSASGTLTATLVSGNLYSVTSVTGTHTATTGATGTRTISGGGGVFYYNGNPLLNAGGIAFNLSGLVGLDTVAYIGGLYQEAVVGLVGLTAVASTTSLNSFQISAAGVPEPSAVALLLAMGTGVFLLARKLPARTVR